MCGIAGFLDTTRQSPAATLATLAGRMASTLHHRGPDDEGVWADQEFGIALGHRRLKIIELSDKGWQPMRSVDGRYVIAYNGEIYNFQALRRELEDLGHTFRGASDTEVLLEAFSEWGVEGALERSNGMFAFAVWDCRKHELHLARDRMGEKPLYYGWLGKSFVFASELKALSVHPAFRGDIDRNVLALYFRRSYIRAPFSIYQGIYKLPAGTMLTVRAGEERTDPSPVSYWSFDDAVKRGAREPFTGTAQEAADCLESLLANSVQLRTQADVPVGAFLSSGVDSSVVVAMMARGSSRPVRTFTIGFPDDPERNESEAAGRVAAYLGTEHRELCVNGNDARSVIGSLPEFFDEPFADSSAIPTFLVSRLARQSVTVSLAGDGGDELFGGYDRYDAGHMVWNRTKWLTAFGRRVLGGAISRAPLALLDRLHWMRPVLGQHPAGHTMGSRLRRVGEFLVADYPESIHWHLIPRWADPGALVLGCDAVLPDSPSGLPESLRRDFRHGMMYLDTVSYLPDDLLAKVDRTSMAVSLETRLPLLDHRVVEFAWSLPSIYMWREGRRKWILRHILERHLPPELLSRRKTGFSVPLGAWLRGPLREWAEDLLAERRLRCDGFLEAKTVREKWASHCSGAHDWSAPLWSALMFQAWLDGARAKTVSTPGAAGCD